MSDTDTIVALSTAEGIGAIAVIRLSGSRSISIVDAFFRQKGGKKLALQASHTLHVGKLMDSDRMLDEVVIALFHAPHSYTGEEVVEVSCHGSSYVVRRLLALFVEAGARPATAGEFTKRAFMHGKLDLTQAEAVSSLIAAESDMAHRIAIEQLRGSVSQKMKHFRAEIVDFAALLELELDFAEEDIVFANRQDLCQRLKGMCRELDALLANFSTAQAFKEGVRVVIAGPPNAGKSTLFNALLQEDKAIVSSIAGTTRDTLEGTFHLHGTRFCLLDTAGIHQSHDALEQEGMRRTQANIQKATVLLILVDVSDVQMDQITSWRARYEDEHRSCLLIGNKSDALQSLQSPPLAKGVDMLVSAKTKSGLEALKERIYTISIGEGYREGVWISELRHMDLLQQTRKALQDAEVGIQQKKTTELVAAELQVALRALGQITGEVQVDTLLQHIFSRFCIGK